LGCGKKGDKSHLQNHPTLRANKPALIAKKNFSIGALLHEGLGTVVNSLEFSVIGNTFIFNNLLG